MRWLLLTASVTPLNWLLGSRGVAGPSSDAIPVGAPAGGSGCQP